ncbi:MAG: glycosyltransferase [Verrucomicrobiota bacterium]
MPTNELRAEDITIAITLYSRREYVCAAVQSALNQTVPVKVMVVEDCGPDPTLKDFVMERFGSRITYIRNPKRRGLFDNWNACIEYCTTPWLSILHDDDLLRPRFVEAMLALNRRAPSCPIYFGRSAILQGTQEQLTEPVEWKDGWRLLDLAEFADLNTVLYPGQLFSIADSRAIGNFRPVSLFTGDWDFWFRMALRGGLAQTAEEVSVVRSHYGADRGTSRVERMGWKWAVDNVQRKRNLALLAREKGIRIAFDRRKLLKPCPIPSRNLLQYAHGFSRRMLRYNHWLFVHSTPPHFRYAVLQTLVRLAGPQGLRLLSQWSQGRRGSRG